MILCLVVIAAVRAGWWLLPGGLSWPALPVIAVTLVPIDLAPAESLVRDRLVPARVRDVLNVESGYNDGIMSPVVAFALILAGTSHPADTPLEALATAVPTALAAIGCGLSFGLGVAWRAILLALLGFSTTWRERFAIGAIGPRGTTSIVFGLLAFNDLPSGTLADTALTTMTLTVIASVLVHGPGAVIVGRMSHHETTFKPLYRTPQ